MIGLSRERRLWRRLDRIRIELASTRDEIAVLEAQLAELHVDDEQAAIRALVSENMADKREARTAKGHADAMATHIARLRTRAAKLEGLAEQTVAALAGEARL
jgi:hypothetical protein